MRDVKVQIEELRRTTFIWITHDVGVILSDERSEESKDPYSCQQSYCAPAALAFSAVMPNSWANSNTTALVQPKPTTFSL